jgi:hypothetical protein
MSALKFLRPNAGRLLRVTAGLLLLAAGMPFATLGGLVMMMAGIFLAVATLAEFRATRTSTRRSD